MMQGSSKEKVRDEMIGGTVMTNYNNKMYVIDDLDFSVKVDDTFPQNDKGNAGEPISYIDYYQKKWNLKIVDRNQFMLKTVDKKSKRVIYLLKVLYLVPELCFMTGMTDKMRADFNLNKDIAVTTKCGAGERMKNTQSLVHDINNPSNERAYACLNDWQIKYFIGLFK
jgi:aubergine-like protein